MICILGLKEKLWLEVLKSELLELGMAVGVCVIPERISSPVPAVVGMVW